MAGAVSAAGLAVIAYGLNSVKCMHCSFEDGNREASNQENVSLQEAAGQTDAAVVDVVNAVRIGQLLKRLSRIECNQAGAEEEILQLKTEIHRLLICNRGGKTGIHGFIGETSQVHISNIKAFTRGEEPLYILLDDNSMTDYLRGMQIIQQKACQSGGHLGLDAIRHHSEKYPEFIRNGGIYQIPHDMYEKYIELKNLPPNIAWKLRREDLRLWKYIQAFTRDNPNIIVEPMEVTYSEIQADKINSTVNRIEEDTRADFKQQREEAENAHAPSVKECLKICGISAVIEGGISAGNVIIQKIKTGKRISEFDRHDWADILKSLIISSGKGAFRGGTMYIASNVYKMPTAFVSGIITAMYCIVHEGFLYVQKIITWNQFLKNSLNSVVDSGASVAGAILGKRFCKTHPIIGGVVGSIIGSAVVSYIRQKYIQTGISSIKRERARACLRSFQVSSYEIS